MATSQEKPSFMNYSPLREQVREGEYHDDYEDVISPSGCGCFRCFGFRWRQLDDDEQRNPLQQDGANRESWLVRKLKKVKEMSEVIAGPKWKNFIRKISGYCKNERQKKRRFQYDPQSYALNFDREEEEEDGLHIGFSSRFSAPLSVPQT